MRKALIVWGGWSGHEPEQCANIIRDMLEEDGASETLVSLLRGTVANHSEGLDIAWTPD